MPLETIFQELPKAAVHPKAELTLKMSFSEAVKLLELQHSAGLVVKEVACGDKRFEADAYKNEIVPGSVEVSATLTNTTDKEVFVRAGWWVETEKKTSEQKMFPVRGDANGEAKAEAIAVTPPLSVASVAPAPAATSMPYVAAPYTPPAPSDPYSPPPPGESKSFQMGDQQITVTTPAPGAPIPGLNGHMTLAGPELAPGQVHSYVQGNQQIRVSAPAAQPQTAHSEVIAAVVSPRVRPGPETVTVGMDEVAILMKRSEAENMLKILNGAILHPAFCTPLVGAVQRALGA